VTSLTSSHDSLAFCRPEETVRFPLSRTLILAGASALSLVTPIGAVISGLLLVVAFSYRQTIHAYPGGGGAYIVAKENVGTLAGWWPERPSWSTTSSPSR
jgi:hypothetical protein